MTILIPYKSDVHNGLELKYALRSIQTYLTGWTDIVLIGDKPNWFAGDVIPANDYPGRKEYSIYQKILTACQYNFVSDKFLMLNDDHYLLKPLHIDEIKYWYSGMLKDELNRRIGGRYKRAVEDTMQSLSNILGNKDFNNYDIHVPIIYEKWAFKDTFHSMTQEICIKSYYCNRMGLAGEEMSDMKIDGPFSELDITSRIKDRLFFSTGTIFVDPMPQVLDKLFSVKSRFEK